ncbi:hypothetical protein HCN44_008612 [Aphidius gifuensis]|uniref:Titin n=1 Tax=Aphidius gifuensis TaxID=684658 RepID=A0A834XMF6_APHGI|nr:uncharacterized protein LOC122858349 [Aphidius gifuensis]KAF7989938.1 hypothetical protein HCN44_008612 [Aphidius gifuensis]
MGNSETKLSSKHFTLTEDNSKTNQVSIEGMIPTVPGKPILIPVLSTDLDAVEICWERSLNRDESSFLGYLIEHRRLGSPHWIQSLPNLCILPQSTIAGLEPGWRYHFRVRAKNCYGFSQPSEISDPLTVTLQSSNTSAPQFEVGLHDTTTLENDRVEFLVQFIGIPIPKISWFKDDFEIFSSRRTRIITENGKSTLLIYQTSLSDVGQIKCTAVNKVGHVMTQANLILEAPPKIRLPRQYEDGLLFKRHETIWLKAFIAGRPLPNVTWFHDSTEIHSDNRHVIEISDSGECRMKIDGAKRTDRGEYTVRAINKVGAEEASFLVTVTDRPASPGKAKVTMTLGRSITLSWKEPSDDGGCKIGSYIVEYYRVGWDVWLKATTCRQPQTTISELFEGSEYKFRVKAENPYGVSEMSEESDIIIIPDCKTGLNYTAQNAMSISNMTKVYQNHKEKDLHRKQKKNYNEMVNLTVAALSDGSEKYEVGSFHPVSIEESGQSNARKLLKNESKVTFSDATPDLEFARASQTPLNSNADNHSNLHSQYQISDKFLKKNPTGLSQQSSTPNHLISNLNSENDCTFSKKKMNLKTHNEQTNTRFFDCMKNTEITENKEKNMIHSNANDPSIILRNAIEDYNHLTVCTSDEEPKEINKNFCPFPRSISFPELFLRDSQITKVLRNAVSLTELLHEFDVENFFEVCNKKQSTKIIEIKKKFVTIEKPIPISNESNKKKKSEMISFSNSEPYTCKYSENSGSSSSHLKAKQYNLHSHQNPTIQNTKLKNDLQSNAGSCGIQPKSILKKYPIIRPIVTNRCTEPLSVCTNQPYAEISPEQFSLQNSTSKATNDDTHSLSAGGAAQRCRKFIADRKYEGMSSIANTENFDCERALIDYYAGVVKKHSLCTSQIQKLEPSEIPASTGDLIYDKDISHKKLSKKFDMTDKHTELIHESDIEEEIPTSEKRQKNPQAISLKSELTLNASFPKNQKLCSYKPFFHESENRVEQREPIFESCSKTELIKIHSIQNKVNKKLNNKADINIRSITGYTIDMTLLIAATYIYFFKKEIFAIPLIGLLLYRKILEKFGFKSQ